MTGPGEDPAANEDPPAQDPAEKPASKRGAVVATVAAVVVLAVVGLVVYLLVKPGDADDADNNADPSPPTITGAAPPGSEVPPSESGGTQPGPLTTPPPPTDENVAAARSVAEEAAAAIENRDLSAMEALACDPSAIGTVEEFPPEATVRLVENPQISGDKATARVELTIAGSEPTVVPLPLEKRGERWCVP